MFVLRRFLSLCACCLVTLCQCCWASILEAQETRLFSSLTPESWHVAGNWTPAFVPTAADTAIVNIGGGFATVATVSDNATALNLIVATYGRARIDHSDDLMNIVDQLTIGSAGSGEGIYNLMNGQLVVPRVVVGDAGDGTLLLGDETVAVVGEHLNLASAPGSVGLIRQRHDSTLEVAGDLRLGVGGTGTLENRGGATRVQRLFVGADPAGGAGTYTFTSGPGDPLGTLEILTEGIVGGGGVGTINISGETIDGGDAGVLRVHADTGRLIGTGSFKIPVVFEDTVTLRFAKDTITTSAILTETTGLTRFNAGAGTLANPTEMVDLLTARMLPGSMHNIHWGGLPGPGNLAHTPVSGDQRPQLEFAFNSAGATGNADVTDANVASRVRLLQFGQEMTSRNGSTSTFLGDMGGQIRTLSSEEIHGKLVSRTQNAAGDFDLGVIGIAVTPEHQMPQVKALHDRGFQGEGVIIGQLEPGLPYQEHGAFDDWKQINGGESRLSFSGLAPDETTISAHATRVASILVGYDPLGIQVNALSKLEPVENRYHDGFGFTGVAPDARLVSRTFSTTFVEDLTALASEPGVKVMNVSAGLNKFNGDPFPATGDNVEELAVDRIVEQAKIVYVQAAGNEGRFRDAANHGTLVDPAGDYNGIVVGNARFESDEYPRRFDATSATLHDSTSVGPTAGDAARSAPHLVAPGTGILSAFMMEYASGSGALRLDPAYPIETNRGLYGTMIRATPETGLFETEPVLGTSFAAPMVAGVASLLVERSRRPVGGFGSIGEDPRLIKSILMTSADKPTDWEQGLPDLHADDSTAIPLSFDFGAGVLDPEGAMDLLESGKFENYTVGGGPGGPQIGTPGWNMATLIGNSISPLDDLPGHVYFLDDLVAGSPLTATLNWYRHVGADMTPLPLSNLDLELLSWDGMTATSVAISNSPIDNLEHIYLDALATGGDYLLRVWDVSADPMNFERYALSWDLQSDAQPEYLPGDTNGDLRIDLEDLNNVRNHFGEGSVGGPVVFGEAFPFDGIVDLADLNLVRNHFGESRTVNAVPEPGSCMLIAEGTLLFLAFLSRRRMRRVRRTKH